MSELAELFAKDPLHLTNTDLDELVTKLRSMRGQFSLENNKKAGNMKAKPAAKPTALATAGITLNLTGLLK